MPFGTFLGNRSDVAIVRKPVPSLPMTIRDSFRFPMRTKAIWDPSGDQTGKKSYSTFGYSPRGKVSCPEPVRNTARRPLAVNGSTASTYAMRPFSPGNVARTGDETEPTPKMTAIAARRCEWAMADLRLVRRKRPAKPDMGHRQAATSRAASFRRASTHGEELAFQVSQTSCARRNDRQR